MTSTESARPPLWVRLALTGVPGRSSAVTFYWLFVAFGLLFPLYVVTARPVAADRVAATAWVGLACGTVGMYWYGAAIQWADRRGWWRPAVAG